MKLGAVPDAAAWRVQDAAHADRVTRVVEHPQVSDDVPDLPALVEAHAADDLVRDAGADEDLFESTRGVVGAIEHRDVVVGEVADAVCECVDLLRDEAGLVVFVVGDVADDELPFAGICPQPLLPPPGVARDDGVGRVEDRLRGAVVLFEQNGCGAGIVALKVLDVADRRTAERVDRLVGIADDAQFCRRDPIDRFGADELTHQYVLRVVGVLVLVDEDVPEATPVVLRDLRERLQHGHRLADQVVEVQRVGRAQTALVFGVDLGDDAGQILRRLGSLGRGLLGSDQLVLQIRDAVGQQPR